MGELLLLGVPAATPCGLCGTTGLASVVPLVAACDYGHRSQHRLCWPCRAYLVTMTSDAWPASTWDDGRPRPRCPDSLDAADREAALTLIALRSTAPPPDKA